MKLDSTTSIYNMGDTSIRVKQVVEINKVILKKLHQFMSGNATWERNTNLQENFYKSFLDEIVKIESEDGIELFNDFQRSKNYSQPTPGKIGLRGRTLTNSLVKLGLVNSTRKISNVGERYLSSSLSNADQIERLLDLDMDNLLYFRQFLKLRIYDFESDSYFYNYRFAIKFLSKYDNVPQNDFLKLLESIKPKQSEDELNQIISNYSNVCNDSISFEEFHTSTFTKFFITSNQIDQAKAMFNQKNFSDEMFMRIFPNRDSSETSLIYKDFVLSLIEVQESTSNNDNLINHLYDLSRDDKIKKAFGDGKIPIDVSRKDTINSFKEKNKHNLLLSTNHFDKYIKFIFSKHNDLIREYSDMGRRAFQVSGLINFENGLANLNNKWIITPLLEILGDRFKLSGHESYSDYEENLNSPWFQDITLIDLFSINDSEIEQLFTEIGHKFGVDDISSISQLIEEKHENDYRDFVDNKFPREKVIKILNNILTRNDAAVFKDVTDNATIPTIYEYILTIAWYHLSLNKSFKLSKTFQVSLDGNKLPLTHRGGGAGDIEINCEDYSLLIEATLMDINNQKRGELEPVIRHSTNFAIGNSPRKTQTIFIANELDNNVLNVFRAMQFVQLNGSYNAAYSINGLNIFALTTKEIICILEQQINDIQILEKINSHSDNSPVIITNGWRDNIISDIISRV